VYIYIGVFNVLGVIEYLRMGKIVDHLPILISKIITDYGRVKDI